MILLLIFFIICAVLGYYGFAALYQEAYLEGAVFYLLAVGVGVAVMWYRKRRGHDFFMPVLNVCVPFLGPMSLVLLELATWNKGRLGLVEDYSIHINSEEHRELFTRDMKEFQPHPEDLVSLADVLHSDLSVVHKRVAIEALSQLEKPETVAILREALSTGSVEVRFFASSVLARLEKRLEDRLQELVKEDGLGHNVLVISELAQTYFDFVFFTIVEGRRREEYLNLALGLALDAFSLEQSNDMLILAGRVLLLKEQYQGAIQIFHRCILADPENVRGWLWRAEAYLANKDYAMVCDDACKALELGGVPIPLQEAVRFWAMGGRNAQAI